MIEVDVATGTFLDICNIFEELETELPINISQQIASLKIIAVQCIYV